jgi:hypothetical protein
VALMNGSRPLGRADIGSWASVAGALALVVGGLIFLIGNQVTIWVFACVILGVSGIGLWMWWTPGEFQAWLSGRQTRFGTTSILISIVFISALVYAYLLVDRANITVDLTSVQRYSLNKPTEDTIAQLEARGYGVRIVAFFSKDKLREQESADLLLRQYEAKGDGAIEIEYVDPDEQPDTARSYGYQAGFDGQLTLVVLDQNGEPRVRPMVQEDGQIVQQFVTIYLGSVSERDITTGLKTVAVAGSFKIYFTVGHRERSLDAVDDTGISRLVVSLEGQGIIAAPLELASETQIPEDADAVLIIGAWDEFTENEVSIIDDYVQRGGRLAILADPPLIETAIVGGGMPNTFLQEGTPFNQYLWDEFGVRVRDSLVIETKAERYNVSEWIPIVDTIVPHEIMQGARNQSIHMNRARTLELVTEPNERQGMYIREPLFFSSELSYGETDLQAFLDAQIAFDPQTDIAGPLLVGATMRRQLEFQLETQPRLIIISDSDVFKNEYVKQFPGNVILWTDTIDWLTGFAEAITFTPVSDPTLLKLVVSDQERNTIAVVTMILLPGLVLLSGIYVWWYRRR